MSRANMAVFITIEIASAPNEASLIGLVSPALGDV